MMHVGSVGAGSCFVSNKACFFTDLLERVWDCSENI